MLLRDKRIFIVEDNTGNRAITQMLLERHGARVSTDRLGRDAVERLKRFAPVDLVILDLMLPEGITGYDVFGEIRELPEFDLVPIVAVSAADASVALPEAQDRGFAGFISKPIDFNLFPQQIARIIDGEEIWYTDEQVEIGGKAFVSSVHALIIDDDGYNLEVLARLLAVEGVSHTAVQDPLQVENTLIEVGPIDVVFLDLEMPKVDGYQVFEILENILGTSVPIVAYTVHSNEIDTARDLGFHSFLGKPLDPGLFPDQLDRILKGKPVWEP